MLVFHLNLYTIFVKGDHMFNVDMKIAGFDDELNDSINKEIIRQEEHVELIASENYASPRVLEAQTNDTALGLSAGTYSCIVTGNTYGCSDTITLTVSDPPTISVSEIIVDASSSLLYYVWEILLILFIQVLA